MNKCADVQQKPEARVKLAPLATISAQWHIIIEAHLFHLLGIGSGNRDTFVDYLRLSEEKSLKSLSVGISEEAMCEDLVFGSRIQTCVTEHLQWYWQNLADSIRDLYTELDGWGQDLELQALSFHFPKHSAIGNSRYGGKCNLRFGLPYKDLSDCFPQDYNLLIWLKMKHLGCFGRDYRIGTAFFQNSPPSRVIRNGINFSNICNG
jgi:hypothetical protein